MIFNKNITAGFTLVESLVNLMLVSFVTASMLLLFYILNVDFDLEANKMNVTNYANKVLDELAEELIKSEDVMQLPSPSNTKIKIFYPNTDTTNIYTIVHNGDRKNHGFFKEKSNSAKKITLDDSFKPLTKFNEEKYEISDFKFKHDLNADLDVNNNDEARWAREASYILTLEIDLFDERQNKIETLKFNRRIFSPAKFIHERSL